MRASSILPLGPEEQYADEKRIVPFDLRVYRGADGAFTLDQDEGDNYDYEKSNYSTVQIRGSGADRTLSLGARHGTYPGMPKEMSFRIVWVRSGHAFGRLGGSVSGRGGDVYR